MRTLRDVMSNFVRTVDSATTVREAARVMASGNIGFLPVTHEGVAAGVITDRDIVVRVVAQGVDPDQTTAGAIVSGTNIRGDDPLEVINSGVAMLPEDTSVDEALRYMNEKCVRRVVVHDPEFRMVGVVSRADLPDTAAAVHD